MVLERRSLILRGIILPEESCFYYGNQGGNYDGNYDGNYMGGNYGFAMVTVHGNYAMVVAMVTVHGNYGSCYGNSSW